MPVYTGAWAAVAAVVLARMLALAAGHLRAALSPARAGWSDVTAAIEMVRLAPSALGESLVVTSVVNPGARPVLVGLSVRRRRCPGWLGRGQRARMVRRTTARRFRAGRQATIGVVAPGATGMLPVHFLAARGRYRVIAVIGQSDHRLRVISLPLAGWPAVGAWPGLASITGLFPWPV